MMPKLPNTNIFYSKSKFSQNLQANVRTWKFDLRLVRYSTKHDSFWLETLKIKINQFDCQIWVHWTWLKIVSNAAHFILFFNQMNVHCFSIHGPFIAYFIIMLISGMNLQ
jgi:hypothetical protein